MPTPSQTPVIWSVVIAAIILLVVGILSTASINSNLKLVGEKLDSFDVDEAAIADAVVEGIDMPEMPEYDTEKVDDVWSVLFGKCILDLKGEDNISEVTDELDWTEVEEYVEDNLENFDKFTSDPLFFLDDSETEVKVTKVGECKFQDAFFNEDEHSKVVVTLEYDFEYEKDDSNKVYKDTLYVTGNVEYDENGELEDVDVIYSL